MFYFCLLLERLLLHAVAVNEPDVYFYFEFSLLLKNESFLLDEENCKILPRIHLVLCLFSLCRL